MYHVWTTGRTDCFWTYGLTILSILDLLLTRLSAGLVLYVLYGFTMYYVVFARYDYSGDGYGVSGRMAYLTDCSDDADRYWKSFSDDCSVRRGGVYGPYSSLHHSDLRDYFLAADEADGRDELLQDVAWYLGWADAQASVPELLQHPPVRPALERPGVTYRS